MFSRIRKRTQGSAFFVLFQTVDFTSTFHSILNVNFKVDSVLFLHSEVILHSPYDDFLKLPFNVRK